MAVKGDTKQTQNVSILLVWCNPSVCERDIKIALHSASEENWKFGYYGSVCYCKSNRDIVIQT